MGSIAVSLFKDALGGLLRKRNPDPSPDPVPHWTESAFARLLPKRAIPDPPALTEEEAFVLYSVRHASESSAQLLQDLFVRWKLGDRRDGFFVEFGATDGVELSNTLYLEKHRSWSGILAEPGRCWHPALMANRTCAIETRCVWKRTGETLLFNEVAWAELSTLQSFSQRDAHSLSRQNGTLYEVETVSLNDLLAERGAPNVIDYLSIDTEGSEFEILESLDFDRYTFRIITVEHNHTADRSRVFELLSAHGYGRVFPQLSRWDDWYVHASVSAQAAT
jgi:FkbM family methyltransferase